MKVLRTATVIILLLTLSSTPSWAATATTSVGVSVTIGSVCTISLSRDMNSVTRGTAGTVVFDRRDDVDRPGVGDPAYMYAPYNSEPVGKNWHVAQIAANGSTTTLDIDVTGTVSGEDLATILELWCAGFFPTGGSGSVGGASSAWETANGWTETLSQAFSGVAPFSYRLRVAEVPAGTYTITGAITFTLTTP